MSKGVARWVMYLNHRNRADIGLYEGFQEFKYKGLTCIAEGTCAEMEVMARLFNGELTNVS